MSNFRRVYDELHLSVIPRFVPWSQSRSAVPNPKLKDYNLNWHVTIMHGDRFVLSTDYSQGYGYCPAYSQREDARPSVDYAAAIKSECETGRSSGFPRKADSKAIALPAARDIISTLLDVADALNYSTFEAWATELGYDPDS